MSDFLSRRKTEAAAAVPVRPTPPSNRRRGVLLLALASIIATSETAVVTAIFPVLRAEFDLTTAHLGLFTTIGLLARTVCGPLWGMLADRFGRTRVLATVVLVWSVLIASLGLTDSYVQFVLLFCIGVVGAVAVEPIVHSILAGLYRDDERGRAFGALRALMGVGASLRVPIFGWLSGMPEGWRTGFMVIGGLQLALGVWIVLARRDLSATPSAAPGMLAGEPPAQFRFEDVPKLWRVPSVRLLAVNYVLVTSIVMLSFLPTFLAEERGFSVEQATLMFGVMNVGVVIGALIGGPMSDRIALKRPRLGRIVLMQCYLVTFAVMTLLIFQVPWSDAATYFALLFLFGILFPVGFAGAVLPMLSAVMLPEIRGTGFGMLASFVQGSSLMFFSLLVGLFSDRYGMARMLLLVVTVPYLLNAAFWFLFYRTYPRDAAAVHEELMRRRLAMQERDKPGRVTSG